MGHGADSLGQRRAKTPYRPPSRRALLATGAALTLTLAACHRAPKDGDEPEAQAPAGPPEGTLEWAMSGAWRAADRPRDDWRHPIETLQFLGLSPGDTVVDFWPGAGWWTEILAPYLSRNQGTLYAANYQLEADGDPATRQIVARFRDRFSDTRLYGDVKMTEFGPTTGPVAPAASCDLALFTDTLAGWMAAGVAEKAFADAFAALKPQAVLGVVQARADAGTVQDPAALNGYVQEAFVKQLAAEAGFIFVAASDINANPDDTKDHPFGVWTLPPQRLSAARGQAANPSFDHSKYDAIGEADRMTLKFRKPN